MNNSLEEISQITIYFKDADKLSERVNEIALFQPLEKKASFGSHAKPLQQRQWKFYQNLPLHHRLFVKVQTFFFHRFKKCIPPERRTPEAQFKTVLAILLAQEALREFFLSSEKRQKNFLQSIEKAAQEWGFLNLNLAYSSFLSPLELSKRLTILTGKEKSLLDDTVEFNLQLATLPHEIRNEILFLILNRVQRPPLTSILEISHNNRQFDISIETKYAKTKVHKWDPMTHQIFYTYTEDEATSSIATKSNIKPGAKGVMNQRASVDISSNPRLICTYSGELSTVENVLEQLLFILVDHKSESLSYLHPTAPTSVFCPTPLLFISLYSWNEWEHILAEHRAIESVDQKYLLHLTANGEESIQKLMLIHINIPFNALNKYPAPAEINAKMCDFRNECLIALIPHIFQYLNLSLPSSFAKCLELFESSKKEWDFLKREKERIDALDLFREEKKKIIEIAQKFENKSVLEVAFKALLLKKTPEEKPLHGIDEYLYFRLVADQLKFYVNTNCQNSTDRSAGANAADKAQNAFEKFIGHPYLPGLASEPEQDLFKVFYSMYLVWEEPELTSGLSTGFMGEKFFRNFFQKNPETTHYLIRWLKKHPDIYLGLSNYR